jgi:aryl-alcohol dehydrogenase-like predicted oxidoreductase
MITLPGSNLHVSPLCYGAGSWGSTVRGETLEKLYSTFRSAGGNAFDTAHCYAFWVDINGVSGEGASERAVGECIRKFDRRREDVVVVTKGGHPSVPPKYPKPDAYLSPEVIRKDLSESLDRLRMDHVDLYFLHRDDKRMPVGEIIDMLAEHASAGRIRHIGASNWSTARIAEANAYAKSHKRPAFVASQVQWSLAEPTKHYGTTDESPRSLSEADVRWHTESNLAVLAYTPTAGGFFASGGKCDPDSTIRPPASASRVPSNLRTSWERRSTRSRWPI